MSDQSATSHPSKVYWFLGTGALLSLIWCGLARTADPQWQAHLWSVLLVTLAGFGSALGGLLWLKGHAATSPGNRINLWLALSLIYPLAILGLFVWANLHPAPTLLKIITHPILLTLNLGASLLIGSILSRLEKRVPKGINLTAWWLWHLPLIFINGSAMLQLNFSNLLMILYLVTVLAVSFGLSALKQN